MISVHRFAVLGPTKGSVVRHRPNVQQVPPFPRCNAAGVHTSITTGQRRSANYKPNIWTYDAIQSLPPASNVDLMRLQAEVLIDGVRHLLEDTTAVEKAAKLELVDWVEKLGLGNLFNKEIDEALRTIASNDNDNEITIQKNGLRLVALRFRLLRQRGYKVSPDGLDEYLGNKTCMLGKNMHKDEKDIMELLEASHLGLDGERVLDAAKAFIVGLPSHWRVQWFDVKKNIETYQKGRNDRQNSALLELAKLNFKMVQSTHQTNFKNMSRWWKNLGLNESLSFTRDRLAESFLWAVGVACEPECGHLREWLTKTINLILVIDDVYDVFGSFDELQIFTDAVVAWDPSIVEQLPECMKICFHALYNTTTEVANEMQEESGDVLPHLKRAWSDFCKAMLVEASWDNIGYTPSLEVYLNNGWISSSGPLLCVHIFLSARTLYEAIKAEPIDTLMNQTQELVLSVSLIIRLCNDLATSAAEIKRGDAPSSVVCYMREANVSEQEAREHIKGVIVASWKRINEQCINMQQGRPELKPLVRMGTNVARMAHCMYHHGDGFGDQDPETRDHIASLLIHPLSL